MVKAIKLQEQMQKPMHNAVAAQSQLLLIGESRAEKLLNKCAQSILAAAESFNFNGQSFTLEAADQNTYAIQACRTEFYQEMSEALKRV
jgi:hypothetical protein